MLGHLWTIRWSNPYTHPPDGKPRILAAYFQPGNTAARHPAALDGIHSLGSGYCISVMSISWPEKQLSKETIVSIRQKRLKGRLNKKVPMFAGQYFQEALEKRPDYFLNGKGRYDLWRVQFTNFEVSRINYLLQHPDQVITDQTIIGELLFTDL